MRFKSLLFTAVVSASTALTAQTLPSDATGHFNFDGSGADLFANSITTLPGTGEYVAYCEGVKNRADAATGNSTEFDNGVLDTDYSVVAGKDGGNAIQIETDNFLYVWHGMAADAVEQNWNSDGTPTDPVYVGSGVNSYTVVMDVQIPTLDKNYTLFEVNEYTSSGGKSGEIVIEEGKLGADYSPFSGRPGPADHPELWSTESLTINTWHQIAYVVDVFYAKDKTIGSVKIYLDGVNVNEVAYGSVDGSSSPNAGELSAAFKVGGNNEGDGYDNTQIIDNLMIFDRTLTNQELIDLNSGSLGTVSFDASKSLKIYPNPTSDFLSIEVTGKSDFKLINSIGQTVISKSIEGKTSVDVRNLKQGLYFVQLQAKDGKISTAKVILK